MTVTTTGFPMSRYLRAVVSTGLIVLFLLSVSGLGGCASGVPSEDPCGNGLLDNGEECEGTNYGGATCESLGRGSGTISCDLECHLVVDQCEGGTCGNDMMDPGEACDGSNLGGRNCLTESFTGGDLRCGADCELDTSGCNNDACGNGNMNPGEMCDDGNLIDGDGCDAVCAIEDGWQCSGAPSVCVQLCGDGTLDPSEDCDGVNHDGASCETLGYDSGPLACSATCDYDTTLCVGDPPCGNSVVEGSEECDSANLNGASCTSLGWDSGILICATDCTHDTSLCAYQTCGNGTIDTGEDCDGGLLGSSTCEGEGFPGGGMLGCTSGCSYDTSSCVLVTCGNGAIDTGEDCDGTNYGTATCQTLGYDDGSLACNGDCTFNEAGCTSTGVCGNSTVEAGEDCDDGNTAGNDGCDASCHWENECNADSTISCGGSNGGSFSLFRFDDDVNFMTSCSTAAATGPEDIYAFVPTSTGLATVDLNVAMDSGFFPDDMDVYILEGGCNQHLCLDHSDSAGDDTVNFQVTAGRTYYIVVELDSLGFPFDGNYSVMLNCP
jgi:cysteine-rich repeat protein